MGFYFAVEAHVGKPGFLHICDFKSATYDTMEECVDAANAFNPNYEWDDVRACGEVAFFNEKDGRQVTQYIPDEHAATFSLCSICSFTPTIVVALITTAFTIATIIYSWPNY